MAALANPMFWEEAARSVGRVQQDGSLRFVVLDRTYRMRPLVRSSATTFTQFLQSDGVAKSCKVAINGNLYGLDTWGGIAAFRGVPDDPKDTTIQGQIIDKGSVVAGDSRPQSFWFGQVTAPTGDAWNWTFRADAGDPPAQASTIAAVGGAGPLIISALRYGTGNDYRPGAPPKTDEPLTGQPPAAAMPYLIQRNNNTFRDVDGRPPGTGKTIVAYCSQKRALLIAVQADGEGPGQRHSALASVLAQRGFDAAVFYDGSDSATLAVDGKVIVRPGQRKDDTIDVGIGFLQ
jgi:hypothetical protein